MSDAGLPEWAKPLETAARLSKFEDEVLGYFAAKGLEVQMVDGVVTPSGDAAQTLGQQQWGLGNLLQTCARGAERQWPELINHHFTTLLSAQRAAKESEIESIDFRAVAGNLAVRLWESAVLENMTGAGGAAAIGKMVTREDLPGLLTVLSMDMPQSVRTVPATEADLWGKSREELFDRAIQNLRRQSDQKISAHELGDGGVVVSVLGESHYIASLALKITDFPELIGKHGSFVGLPTRHVMLVAPFGGLDALKSLQHLMTITTKWFADGPGSLSGRVWWYRPAGGEEDAAWFEVPFEVTDQALNVTPPPELLELMEDLAGGGEREA